MKTTPAFVLTVASVFFSPVAFCFTEAEIYQLKSAVHATADVPFLSHSGRGGMDNYLTLTLPFEPIREVFNDLVSRKKKRLISRGEAHITVITPIEYSKTLAPQGVTQSEIDEIAAKAGIQKSAFKVICLGKGEAQLGREKEETYFVVVESEDLLKIRSSVQTLFIAKGGEASRFNPSEFYPHITVGFTARDLHESDGVKKDAKSCEAAIQETL